MGRKSAPCPAYQDWTEARFWKFIRSTLRAAASSRWPPRDLVLKEARRPGFAKQCLCAKCNTFHAENEVTVDHIVPVGTLRSPEDLPGFVERLFCRREGLQVLCAACHSQKSAEERSNKQQSSISA